MLRARLTQWLMTAVWIVMLAAAYPAHARADNEAVVHELNGKLRQLLAANRLADGAAIAEKGLAAAERELGPEHPETLASVDILASFYKAQGRYKEAAPLFKRALTARERVLGKDNLQTLISMNNLAALYEVQNRYSEAEPIYRRALASSERALGKEHANTLALMNNLAGLYVAQGRYALAKPLYERALAIQERLSGKDHEATLHVVNNLATLIHAEGRHAEAEPLFRRALEGAERTLGKEHLFTLSALANLGEFYRGQGRHTEAEALTKRALAGGEKVLGKDHPSTIGTVNNLAELYRDMGRKDEAEALMKRALQTSERTLGRDHMATIRSANNLGLFYQQTSRYAEAEPLLLRAKQATEKAVGKDHPLALISADNLAALYSDMGRYAEAEALFTRNAETGERLLGVEHPITHTTLGNFAALYAQKRDWGRAVPLWRRSSAAVIKRFQRAGPVAGGKEKSVAGLVGTLSSGLVAALDRWAQEGGVAEADSARETFEHAQWAQGSDTARSVAQMAARAAPGNPAVAALVRERQDLVQEWQTRDTQRVLALAKPAAARDAKDEAANSTRLSAIETRLAAIDKQLETSFPDYASLSSLAPLPVAETQALLKDDEALVLFLNAPKSKILPAEFYVWVVTRTSFRWARVGVDGLAIADDVQALRCGLDALAWAGKSRCAALTGADFSWAEASAGKPLPFDHARAHKLYKTLFGKAEDLIKGKQLLVVPSGALTQLPFSVLVIAPPSSNDSRNAEWLARRHAVTVLPAVSSLKALRRIARKSAATKPFLGLGNPLLDGSGPEYAEAARVARGVQSCSVGAVQTTVANLTARRSVSPAVTQSGLADLSVLRMASPLPETAVELCAVAADLHADASDMRLGARATERALKEMSANGQLAQFRVVHFATHGALAGQLTGSSEPGLILTPPTAASAEDDGFLTASEIAALKLDADWVILSACNTAGGETADAPALSGLARAFIYAQARAMLVSHWAVNSSATVKLATTAMHEMSRDAAVGRAEAVRRAMVALIEKGKLQEAHPAYWAPFIVVGEGTR